jgi:Polyketide cyclase / dehydrase and lipid transport
MTTKTSTNTTAERASSIPLISFAVSVHVNASPEITFGVLADLRTHLEWSGKQAPNDSFKLLALEAPPQAARIGTTFSSTGANGMGMTFHDRSVVTEATAPTVLAFRTQSELTRKHRPTWQARFEHRYEVSRDGDGSRVDYRGDVYPANYRPFWLHPLMRPMTRILVPRMMVKNMRQLAMMVERRAT